MEKFTTVNGVAAPMRSINIDTDKIIPKQYLKTIERTGLGKNLFAEMRYNEDGSERDDFVLNKLAYRKSQILVAGDNFGCGSSREHAPWAILDFGIKVVISTSFADIFYNNCFKNGLLPIVLTKEEVDRLFQEATSSDYRLKIDLESQTVIMPNGDCLNFSVDGSRKYRLLNGLDDIDLSLQYSDQIREYESKRRKHAPWLFRELLPL